MFCSVYRPRYNSKIAWVIVPWIAVFVVNVLAVVLSDSALTDEQAAVMVSGCSVLLGLIRTLELLILSLVVTRHYFPLDLIFILL